MVDTVEAAFRDYADGKIVTPSHERVRLVWPPKASVRPYDRDMRILPAMLPSLNAAGLRMGCKSEVNPGSTSLTVLLEFDRMRPLALIEDHFLHGVRSGITGGIGTRHLSRADATTVGVIGCGRIAQVQLASTIGQRHITKIKVFSRNQQHREEFAALQVERFGIETAAVASADEAVSDVDIVLSATDSHNAHVFDGHAVTAGALVVSVTPGEIDPALALRSRVVLTSANRVLTDYTPQEPIASLVKSGQLKMEDMPLLSEVLVGRAEGRQSDDQIVFLFSPGIGFSDLAAARTVFDIATGTKHHALQGAR
jgi:ornithine cyclodeaminase/alanine dehydrogenase-like protein (mu-crystallin family)